MASKDTISFRITKVTREDLEKIRKIIASENNLPIELVTLKQAEIIMRMKARNGSVSQKQVQDVLMGKIR